EPDRVWSCREDGIALFTLDDRVYCSMGDDLPPWIKLHRGRLSPRDYVLLSGVDLGRKGPRRIGPGDLVEARIARSTKSDEMPWRIDAIDRDGEYDVFGFASEAEARNVLGVFERRVLGTMAKKLDEKGLDDARKRFEADAGKDA